MKPTLIKFSIYLYGCQIYSYIVCRISYIVYREERKKRKEELGIQESGVRIQKSE
jgi:hypothetical protein